MRRILPLLILALAIAAPAGAQQTGRYAIPSQGAARENPPLRGALVADGDEPGAAQPQPSAPMSPAPTTGALFPPPSSDAAAGQCRLACDRSYYFCLSDDNASDCPGDWSRCRAGCG